MMREVSTESLEENARRMDKLTSSLRRHVRHAGLQECFNQLADCIVKDFVDFWYISMLNASPVAGLMNQRQQEHQSWATVESTARSDFKRLIHCALVGSFINLHHTLKSKFISYRRSRCVVSSFLKSLAQERYRCGNFKLDNFWDRQCFHCTHGTANYSSIRYAWSLMFNL